MNIANNSIEKVEANIVKNFASLAQKAMSENAYEKVLSNLMSDTYTKLLNVEVFIFRSCKGGEF